MNKKLYMQKNKEDVEFGNNSENTNIKILNEYFKINLQQRKAYTILDFIDIDNKIIIELKGRRVNKNDYKDTIISVTKINNSLNYLKDGYKIYFAFSFLDKLCYYEFDGIINKKWIKINGRCDRGKNEYNNYYHIPCKLLKEI